MSADGWLCLCGAWIEDGSCCHQSPPWGCVDDCGIDLDLSEDDYDFGQDDWQ